MIQSITIQNFQSHENTFMELSPGVNVIVGQSDSGKTAILRALRWLVWNRPSGEALRSYWGGDTLVKIVLENEDGKSFEISRERNKKDNMYRIGEGEPLKAVRMEVPEQVRRALRFDTINLQQQHDNIFLLTSNSGEVAQHFNRIANLDAIDRGLTNLKRWTGRLETAKKQKEADLESHSARAKSYDYLPKLERGIAILEGSEEDLARIYQQRATLSRVAEGLTDVTKKVVKAGVITRPEKLVAKTLKLYEKTREKRQETSDLRGIILGLERGQRLIAKRSRLTRLSGSVEKAASLYAQLSMTDRRIEVLAGIIRKAENVQTRGIKMLREIKEMEERMPNTCPLCGSAIKKGKPNV